jgi:hypothetical protein
VNVKDVVLHSYRAARGATIEARSLQQRHQLRAGALVAALADELHTQCAAQRPAAEVVRFTRADGEARATYSMDELLFDICVCEADVIHSMTHRIDLRYIRKALWQVQVEFEHDARATIARFSRLVLGSAENKLLVAPLTSDPAAVAELLAPVAMASAGPGNVHLALVPHPSAWEIKPDRAVVYRLNDGEWNELK